MTSELTTKEQREAFAWALDVLFDELNNYLAVGDPQLDYGDEWKEIATERANHMRAIADWTPFMGDQERWLDLAEKYDDSFFPGEIA